MTNWVLATDELPSKYIGFNLSPESAWFMQGDPLYWDMYSDEYHEVYFNTDISLINTNYISKSNDVYKGKLNVYAANSVLKNENNYITFDLDNLTDNKLYKAQFPSESDEEWYHIGTHYNVQNVDPDYLKVECDIRWKGDVDIQFLNNLRDTILDNYDETGYMYSEIRFGYFFFGETGTTIEELGNGSVWDLADGGNRNFFILMRGLNDFLIIEDDDVRISSVLLYTIDDDQWNYYIVWNDTNGKYYYHKTDKFFNHEWIHFEYSRSQNTATLKIDNQIYEFPVSHEDELTLGLESYGCPIFTDYVLDCRYEVYGYSQIANLKTYVVAEETFDFEAPYVYVKNSNYRDHFFLSAEVDNYGPAGYEILWDNGERTKSIACEFGEYHEVTVTNRAGSTTEWNVAGFGEVRVYNYLADIGIVSIPLTETGTIINAPNSYRITNNTDYSENCSIEYYANNDSIIANDLGTAYINKKSDAVSALRENGYYTLSVSRYDDYSEYATGIGFTVSWKMKLLNNIDDWLADAQSNVNYEVDCYGYLLCFDGYGRSGIHLYLTSVNDTLCAAVKSVKDTSKKSILPSEFINGEWVDCMLCKCEDNKYFFNVNGYTLFDFEDDSVPNTVYLYSTVLLGMNRVDLKNIKTPYIILKDIKRSMQLRKER